MTIESTPDRRPTPDNEVYDFIHEVALREDELRGYGARPERIRSDYARRFGARLAKLAINHDITAALPHNPEQTGTQSENDGPMQRWGARTHQKNLDVIEEGEPQDIRSRQFKDS